MTTPAVDISQEKRGSILPPLSDGRGKRHAVVYTEREQQVIKEIFSLVFQNADLTGEFGSMIEGESTDQYYTSTINMAIATGLSFTVTKAFMAREFQENANNTTGGPYLKLVFGNIIHQIVTQDQKISYEVDPSKCENKAELSQHADKLIEKMTFITNQITDPKILDAMPPEIRIIAGYIAEISKEYVPTTNVSALVGGFLLLRWSDSVSYFNPALLTPEQHGLLPEGKTMSATARRNLILMSKILQNLSNGLEFGRKEQYMMVVNDFINVNKDRMEKYFQDIVSFVPPDKGTALYAPDPKAVTADDFHIMHRFFTKNQNTIQNLFPNKQDAATLNNLMEKMGSYSSKTSFSFLSAADRKAVTSLLEAGGDEPLYVGWVDKRRRNKVQKRLFVLAREGHMLDLIFVNSLKPDELEVRFRTFSILCNTEDTNPIISAIRRCYAENFPATPDPLRAKFNIGPPARKDEIETDIILPEVSTLCGGYVAMYQTMCNYYQTQPHPDVCWHFTHLPAHVRTFDLKRFTKNYCEVPVDTLSLGSMFYAMRYSTYFDRINIKGWKLDRDSFLDFVQMMRFNGSLEEITLHAVGGTSSLFGNLFEAMASNPDCKVSSIEVTNNNVDDKGAIGLASYIKVAKSHLRMLYLDECSIGKSGFTAIFKELWDRGKRFGSELRIFSASDNKNMGLALDSFCPMLEKCGQNVTELHLKNTGVNLSVLLPALTRSCPNLHVLDLSNNKCKQMNCVDVCSFLQNSTSLRSLNMASCKIPHESLKDILTSPSNQLELSLNLTDNGLTTADAVMISTLPFKMTSITELNLSDNDLGDEGIAAIAEGLCASSSVRSLVLNRCWNGKAKAPAVENLGKLISTNRVLESLSIVGAKTPLKADLYPFLYSLGTNSSISKLDISGHQMGNRGAIILAKSLMRNFVLTELHWDDNMTGSVGFSAVENAMHGNQSVRNMQLPIFDIGLALKNEAGAAKEIQEALSSIEQSLVRNQQGTLFTIIERE
ncbi:hypothetical protein PROFUN_03899 [Planoprotostelium fungivorum]|uniref:Ras-GAP domain-containing protein n=1 Tax=Planoprotostelium fungivorum TaxID=1890364 RepID=A0A2P6MTN5_9EUKA|nr:hypothetical protein PROFUN_03899 [Planoprotostelium fungivorum]